jgi:sulfur-carrier protein
MTNEQKKYKVKAFGITRDILGVREAIVEMDTACVADLRKYLLNHYPALGSLRSLFIAVNNSYAEDDLLLTESDEIALIPPVSGG